MSKQREYKVYKHTRQTAPLLQRHRQFWWVWIQIRTHTGETTREHLDYIQMLYKYKLNNIRVGDSLQAKQRGELPGSRRLGE